jgi:hypothetical protein
MAKKQNKIKVSIALHPELLDKVKKVAEEESYNSVSNVISDALVEFFNKSYSSDKVSNPYHTNITELMKIGLGTEEGQKILANASRKDLENRKEEDLALQRAGTYAELLQLGINEELKGYLITKAEEALNIPEFSTKELDKAYYTDENFEEFINEDPHNY